MCSLNFPLPFLLRAQSSIIFLIFPGIELQSFATALERGQLCQSILKRKQFKGSQGKGLFLFFEEGPEHYIVSCDLVFEWRVNFVKAHFCSSLLPFQWNVGWWWGEGWRGVKDELFKDNWAEWFSPSSLIVSQQIFFQLKYSYSSHF